MSNYFNQVVNYNLAEDDSPDHTYIDLSIVNNNPNGKSVPLIFNDLRSTPILTNPKDYYVAVVRFHLDTFGGSLPLWIPMIQSGQSDPNLTVYSFTLAYKTYVYEAFMTFIPTNKADTVGDPTNGQDMRNEYYFVSNYSALYRMVNNTLKSAFDGLSALAGSEMPSTVCPFLMYDSIGKSIIINADKTAYDVETVADPIYIYTNNQMNTLLSGFEWEFYGEQPNGTNYRLYISDNLDSNTYEDNGVTYIQAYEGFPSVEAVNPLQSIIFTSATLPIEQCIVSNSSAFNSTTTMNVSSNSATQAQITDFSVAVDINSSYLPCIDYTAPAQYRLVDMYGNGIINNVQLAVYWKDIYNNTYPFYLNSGASCSVKLVFRKKSFNH